MNKVNDYFLKEGQRRMGELRRSVAVSPSGGSHDP